MRNVLSLVLLVCSLTSLNAQQLQYQTTSQTCGQTCVAMVCEISIEEATNLIGHNHETSTGEIYDALVDYGFEGVFVNNGKPLPGDTAIVLFTNGVQGHWVVYHKHKYYDPRSGVSREVPNHLGNYYIKKHIKVKHDTRN